MTDMAARLDRVIDNALAENRIVGTVLTVGRNGDIVYRRAAGMADREVGREMQEDAIFRLASVTKPMVSATALALIERDVLDLDRPITEWLPDFKPRLEDGFTPEITIRHLLTHTGGFGYPTGDPNDPYTDAGVSGGLDSPGLSMEENLERISSAPLYFQPGSAWRYGVATDILGAVIAAATGGTLGGAVAEHVTGPLGMTDTAFRVTDADRLAVAYADGPDGPTVMADPQSIPTEPGRSTIFSPSRIFDPNSFQSGGGGMAGSAADVFHFLDTIRAGGGPILKPETVEAALTNQVGNLRDDLEPGAGFGFMSAVIVDGARSAKRLPTGAVRWGGVYGHDWLIDPGSGLMVLSCTNTAVEGCMGRYRDTVIEAVLG